MGSAENYGMYRNNVVKIVQSINTTDIRGEPGKICDLAVIEDEKNYEEGNVDISPPHLRIAVDFPSEEAKLEVL